MRNQYVDAGLFIINVSDPTNPELINSFGNNVVAVAINGNYAYVASNDSGIYPNDNLYIIDISDPFSPTEVSYLRLDDSTDVVVAGHYVYVATSYGFSIVDISNPANPVGANWFILPGYSPRINLIGGTLYVANADRGFQILNITNPITPVEVGVYDPFGGNGNSLATQDNLLYFAGGYELGVLYTTDIADPVHPTSLSYTDTWKLGYIKDITIIGNYIYGSDYKLFIFDVSDPLSPKMTGFSSNKYVNGEIALSGNYAYIARTSGPLWVFDVSDVQAPTLVNYYNDIDCCVTEMVITNNHAYISSENGATQGGLWIFDISNPISPIITTIYTANNGMSDVAIQGNYAYLASYEGLRIIDISNPASPIEVGSYDAFGYINKVEVEGDFAYVLGPNGTANGMAVVHVINISDSASPTEVGFYEQPHDGGGFGSGDNWEELAVKDGYIYLVAQDSGLHVLYFNDIYAVHIEVTQVIQDETNSVPLIAGKPTYARVYINCGNACNTLPSNLSGKLFAYNAETGQEIPIDGSNNYMPSINTITAHNEDWKTQRDELEKSLNFSLPEEWWVQERRVNLVFELDEQNITKQVQVEFKPSKPITIIGVPIRYKGLEPQYDTTTNVARLARRLFPTSRVNYIPGAIQEYVIPNKIQQWFGNDIIPMSNFLMDLYALQVSEAESDEVPDYLFGWLPQDTGDYKASGRAWVGSRVAFGVSTGQFSMSKRIFAHEIGHLLRVRHTNTIDNINQDCTLNSELVPDWYIEQGGNATQWRAYVDLESEWPKEHGTSKIDTYGLKGDDFAWLIESNRAIQNPENIFDYMSYCGFGSSWTSAWAYKKVYEELQYDSNNKSIQKLTTPQSYLVVSGYVLTDTTAAFGPMWTITATNSLANPAQGTEYCLDLQDNTNTTLADYCFDMSFVDYETNESSGIGTFYFTLPYPPGLNRVVLNKESNELAVQLVSPNSPVLNITSPAVGEIWIATDSYSTTWVANDVDGDSLIYHVLYSQEGGSWIPLGVALTQTHLLINAADLAGGNDARIRVMASDGINTTIAESESFIVESKKPQVTIFSPETDGNIPLNNFLLLEGYAYDLEDGILAEDTLSWHSNIDSDLGTGSQTLVTLSPGQHIITFSAIDSDNNVVTATVNISVSDDNSQVIYLPVILKN